MSKKTYSSIRSLIGNAKRILILEAPNKYAGEIDEMAVSYQLSTNANKIPTDLFDFILIFIRNKSDLSEFASAAVSVLHKEGSLWFGYPSPKSSRPSDITTCDGWEVLSDAGWKSVSDLAIDSSWNVKNFTQQAIYGY
tara:strand:+ start:2767 stop:3180 length:414 start_codon:yes stop_codon:yes gene_type:complete